MTNNNQTQKGKVGEMAKEKKAKKVWTVSEAYRQAHNEEEISAYCSGIYATREEALATMRAMIKERVVAFYEGADIDKDIIDAMVGSVINDGENDWYRWVNPNDGFAWNIQWHNLKI